MVKMWRRGILSSRSFLRRLTTASRHRIEDEGDWLYSSEWWGTESQGHTVFRSVSDKGNGVVSVIAFPSSRPRKVEWPETAKWLQRRFAKTHSTSEHLEHFGIIGYQWRALRFNEDTRQSTVKVMAAYQESKPGSVFFMQQGDCLAVPYLKSMVSVGLASIACCNYDIINAAHGKKDMNILCIGHGGGSLPLFLASKIQGAVVDIVEIDPVVIKASTEVMGFPPYSVMAHRGVRYLPKPDSLSEVLWKGIHERLFLYESDAEKFARDTKKQYDIVFIDAYDGDDIFPRKLWDPDFPFLKSLSDHLHPEHGTVVVNLHSDSDLLNPDGSVPSVSQQVLPMGRYVSSVCRSFKDVLLEKESVCGAVGPFGLGFTVSVPWVCNTSLVVSRGFQIEKVGGRACDGSSIVDTLASKSIVVENALDLTFSCLQYIRGFQLVD